MIGFYNYTVILTYIGMLFGFTGITFAMNSNTKAALICLLFAGLCDMFDGKVAATRQRTNQEKRFGIQIDSLSDLICFGVLPASIIYMGMHTKTVTVLCITALYALCALIRLAWFNVDEEERQNTEDGGRETYLGLPVTSSALIFPILFGICKLLSFPPYLPAQIAMVLTAIAFLSPFKLKKPESIGKLCMILCGAVVFAVLLVRIKR